MSDENYATIAGGPGKAGPLLDLGRSFIQLSNLDGSPAELLEYKADKFTILYPTAEYLRIKTLGKGYLLIVLSGIEIAGFFWLDSHHAAALGMPFDVLFWDLADRLADDWEGPIDQRFVDRVSRSFAEEVFLLKGVNVNRLPTRLESLQAQPL